MNCMHQATSLYINKSIAHALKDLLSPTNLFYEYVLDSKSREEQRKYRIGQTTTKHKVKVDMLEGAFEGGECLGKKKNDKSLKIGKHRDCYGRGIGLGLARA